MKNNHASSIVKYMKRQAPEKYNMKYLTFSNLGKYFYVMLNHRVACLCWMDALRKGYIKHNAFLCHIDWHSDFAYPLKEIIIESAGIQENQEKKLKEFVKNKLDPNNSDFIVPSMYRELIGDALSIYSEKNHNNIINGISTEGTTDNIPYKDKKGKLHSFYIGGSSINQLDNYTGLLGDRNQHQDVQRAFNKGVRDRNFVLDIDLYYFTYEDSEEQKWAMNVRNIDTILKSDVFINFLNVAQIITIALEPFHCGGSEECIDILTRLSSNLKKYLGSDIAKEVIETYKKELSS